MKLPYTFALALVLLASCGPSIKQSTTRAETAANRTERSATLAQQAADRAFKASVRALIAADQAEKDARRGTDAVMRMEAGTVKHGDLLVKPAKGSPLFWCLMDPPILQSSPMGSETIDFYAPRSEFWVDEIFDSKSECHDALRKLHRQFVRFDGKGLPFRSFCAACSNEGETDED